MNYAEIKERDIANGPGVRVTLFVSGCTNRCEGCFQPETWDFNYGSPFSDDVGERIIELMRPDFIRGLTVLGGEPFEPKNQEALLPFLKRVRRVYPKKDIWAFSGFTLEELTSDGSYPKTEFTREILSLIDVLVDGRFHLEERDISLRFRGSRNQRVLDVPRSLECGRAEILKGF